MDLLTIVEGEKVVVMDLLTIVRDEKVGYGLVYCCRM